MTATVLQPRLSSAQSQRAFDAVLGTLAEPGTIRRLDTAVFADGVPVVGVLTLALADVEVTINVDGDPEHPLARVLAHTTDARLADVDDADILTLTTADPAVVARCRPGTALEPERGARLAVRVDAIHSPPAPGDLVIDLSGPGVPGTRRIGLGGVPRSFLDAIAATNRAFPAGIDTWFVSDEGDITAISRSTHLTVMEEN